MKKKFLKEILCVCLCFAMCFLMASIAVADDSASDDATSLRFINIMSTSCALTISGINSTSNASMATATTNSLSIKMELQKLKSGTYTTIETWSTSRTGTTIAMEEDRLINILSDYRLKVTFKAGTETFIDYAYPS